MPGPRGWPWWLARRQWVQLASAVLANGYFLSPLKGFCYPALNCWACPTANFACPIGALQNSFAAMRLALRAGGSVVSAFPFYVLGSTLLFSALFGRMMCGWLCPFGWFQELVGRRGLKRRIPRWTWHLRFVVLVVLVAIVPYHTGESWFSKLCPMGSLEGGIPQPLLHPELRSQIGALWYLKMAILAAAIGGAFVWRRPFCGMICPLGALFSFFNRYSALQIAFDRDRCTNCEWCVRNCPQGLDPRRDVNGHACVSCLQCTKCRFGAIASHAAWRAPGAAEPATRTDGALPSEEKGVGL